MNIIPQATNNHNHCRILIGEGNAHVPTQTLRGEDFPFDSLNEPDTDRLLRIKFKSGKLYLILNSSASKDQIPPNFQLNNYKIWISQMYQKIIPSVWLGPLHTVELFLKQLVDDSERSPSRVALNIQNHLQNLNSNTNQPNSQIDKYADFISQLWWNTSESLLISSLKSDAIILPRFVVDINNFHLNTLIQLEDYHPQIDNPKSLLIKKFWLPEMSVSQDSLDLQWWKIRSDLSRLLSPNYDLNFFGHKLSRSEIYLEGKNQTIRSLEEWNDTIGDWVHYSESVIDNIEIFKQKFIKFFDGNLLEIVLPSKENYNPLGNAALQIRNSSLSEDDLIDHFFNSIGKIPTLNTIILQQNQIEYIKIHIVKSSFQVPPLTQELMRRFANPPPRTPQNGINNPQQDTTLDFTTDPKNNLTGEQIVELYFNGSQFLDSLISKSFDLKLIAPPTVVTQFSEPKSGGLSFLIEYFRTQIPNFTKNFGPFYMILELIDSSPLEPFQKKKLLHLIMDLGWAKNDGNMILYDPQNLMPKQRIYASILLLTAELNKTLPIEQRIQFNSVGSIWNINRLVQFYIDRK